MNDYAVYDTLFLINRLERNFMHFPKVESINFFSYLSCLISIFDRRPYSDWGYKFHLTSGEISSIDILTSIDYLANKGLISYETIERGYKLSSSGKRFFELIEEQRKYSERKSYLKGSADLTVISEEKILIDGIYANDDISVPNSRSAAKPVLSELAQHDMYTSLNSISTSIGIKSDDIIMSTLLWINYKAKENSITEDVR